MEFNSLNHHFEVMAISANNDGFELSFEQKQSPTTISMCFLLIISKMAFRLIVSYTNTLNETQKNLHSLRNLDS